MTRGEAELLAVLALAAIDRLQDSLNGRTIVTPPWIIYPPDLWAADRERLASDIAGLRTHTIDRDADGDPFCRLCGENPCEDARRYADGLRRTAALYGVRR